MPQAQHAARYIRYILEGRDQRSDGEKKIKAYHPHPALSLKGEGIFYYFSLGRGS